jgi:hypothetical protein
MIKLNEFLNKKKMALESAIGERRDEVENLQYFRTSGSSGQ